MAAQQGFQYEENAAKILKKKGIVPKNFQPAGASHDQPDLMLEHKGEQSGCELKITAASAGSLVLKYDSKDKRNPWKFGDISEDDAEKVFIRDLAKEVKLFTIIKKKWEEVPLKREKDALLQAQTKSMTKKRFQLKKKKVKPRQKLNTKR